jgi:hypothetical protein
MVIAGRFPLNPISGHNHPILRQRPDAQATSEAPCRKPANRFFSEIDRGIPSQKEVSSRHSARRAAD